MHKLSGTRRLTKFFLRPARGVRIDKVNQERTIITETLPIDCHVILIIGMKAFRAARIHRFFLKPSTVSDIGTSTATKNLWVIIGSG